MRLFTAGAVCARFRDIPHRQQSSSLLNRIPLDSETPSGELPNSWSRNFDTSMRRVAAPVFSVGRKIGYQAAGAVAWDESGSRSFFGNFVQKGLPLIAGQELEEPRN